jgi:hypothetical protein
VGVHAALYDLTARRRYAFVFVRLPHTDIAHQRPEPLRERS